MNKYTKTIAISTVLVLFLAVMIPSFVNAQVNGGDDINPPASDNVSTTNNTVNNTIQINGFDDSPANAESLNNNTSNNTNTSILNGGDDINQPITPTPPTPPASNGSTGGSTGSSSGGSRSGGSRIVALPTLTSLNSCIYINDYLKFGSNNNSAEVTKLQSFLKNTEKIDVNINGVFDNKTFEAVKAFQAKYTNDVLLPWGGNIPTGHVYFTTKKKINEIYCKSNFSLTAEQLAQIEAYKKDRSNGIVPAEGNRTSTNPINTETNINSTTTISLTPELGSEVNVDQTASVSSATSTNIVKKFFKWLFGY